MNLGFILSKDNPFGNKDNPFDMNESIMHLLSMRKGTQSIRSTVIEKGSTNVQIFSCMAYHCDLADRRHSIEFYMGEDDFERYSDLFVHPFRTDSRDQTGMRFLSKDMRLRDAVPDEN